MTNDTEPIGIITKIKDTIWLHFYVILFTLQLFSDEDSIYSENEKGEQQLWFLVGMINVNWWVCYVPHWCFQRWKEWWLHYNNVCESCPYSQLSLDKMSPSKDGNGSLGDVVILVNLFLK